MGGTGGSACVRWKQVEMIDQAVCSHRPSGAKDSIRRRLVEAWVAAERTAQPKKHHKDASVFHRTILNNGPALLSIKMI